MIATLFEVTFHLKVSLKMFSHQKYGNPYERSRESQLIQHESVYKRWTLNKRFCWRDSSRWIISIRWFDAAGRGYKWGSRSLRRLFPLSDTHRTIGRGNEYCGDDVGALTSSREPSTYERIPVAIVKRRSKHVTRACMHHVHCAHPFVRYFVRL